MSVLDDVKLQITTIVCTLYLCFHVLSTGRHPLPLVTLQIRGSSSSTALRMLAASSGVNAL